MHSLPQWRSTRELQCFITSAFVNPINEDPCSSGILIQQFDDLLMTSGHIRNWTQRYPILSRVQQNVLIDWPESDPLTPKFQRVRHELNIQEWCVMRGARIVLQRLHSTHSGVVNKKALARSYIWWPVANNAGSSKKTRESRLEHHFDLVISTEAIVTGSSGLCGSD